MMGSSSKHVFFRESAGGGSW